MENDYKRNYFWIKRDLKGNKHYYFKIKGQYHEVSEEVYKTCYNSFKKEEREKEKRSEFKVSSLDQLDNNNTALVDKIADDKNQYDTFNVNEEVENVNDTSLYSTVEREQTVATIEEWSLTRVSYVLDDPIQKLVWTLEKRFEPIRLLIDRDTCKKMQVSSLC